jgi:hypothetical protein
MNKNKIIQLALKSPRTSDKVCPFSISQLMEKRVDSCLFKMYFEEISGLNSKDAKYTIKNEEYPWHIQEEKANKTYKRLKRGQN